MITPYRMFRFIFLLCLALHTHSVQTLNLVCFYHTLKSPSCVSVSAIATLACTLAISGRLSQRHKTLFPFPFSLSHSVPNITPKTSAMISRRCECLCTKLLRILSDSRTNSAQSAHPFPSPWKRKAKIA